MSRCLLTVQGVLWLGGGTVVAWAGLFAVAAYINRKIRGKGPIYG